MQSQAQAFAANIGQTGGKISGAWKNAFSLIGGSALLASFRALTDRFRDISREADKFGESAETIQRVQKVARLSGVEFDVIGRTISKITVEAKKAADGNEEMADKFKDVGINAKEFLGLSMDQKLVALKQAHDQAAGSANKQAAMIDLLGERGVELNKVLATDVSKTLKDVSVVSDGTVKQLRELSETFDKLSNKGTAFASKLLIPVMKGLMTAGAATNAVGKELANRMFNSGQERVDNSKDIEDEYAGKVREIWNPKAPEKTKGTVNDEESAAQRRKDAQDAAKVAEDALTRRQKLLQEIAALEEKRQMDSKSSDEKINALVEKRLELLRVVAAADTGHEQYVGWNSKGQLEVKTHDGIDSNESALEAKKQALEIEKQISEEQKRAQAEQDAHEKRIDDARRREQQVDDEVTLKHLDKAGQIEFLKKKKTGLETDAKTATIQGDEETATDKRIEAKRIGIQIEDLQAKTDDEKRPKVASVAVSSLQRVGGGGTTGPATDPSLRYQQRLVELTEQQLRAIQALSAGKSATRPGDPLG